MKACSTQDPDLDIDSDLVTERGEKGVKSEDQGVVNTVHQLSSEADR